MHAELLVTLSFASMHGINVQSYAIEDAPELEEAYDLTQSILTYNDGKCFDSDVKFVEERIPRNKFYRNPLIDGEIIAEHESIERKYRAIKEGRITDRIPDFIGTWNTEFPAEGLFEFFIMQREGNIINGTIEDVLGTATLQGTIDNSTIEFRKEYSSLPIKNGRDACPIFYRGLMINDEVKGSWSYSFNRSDKRKFEMKRFSS